MATTTTNYGLTKPDGSDKAQIGVLNGNFDEIDAQMKRNEDAAKTAKDIADGKQDPITVDDAPIMNSTNPIQSGAVYSLRESLTERISGDEDAIEAAQEAADNAQTSADNAQAAAEAAQRAADAAASAASTAQQTADGAASAASSAAAAVTAERNRALGVEQGLANAIDDLGLQVVNGKLCAVYNT